MQVPRQQARHGGSQLSLSRSVADYCSVEGDVQLDLSSFSVIRCPTVTVVESISNNHKVYLTADADNPGVIIRSYEKSGFKKDGILRDEVYKNGQYVDRIIMSIFKHEYVKL